MQPRAEKECPVGIVYEFMQTVRAQQQAFALRQSKPQYGGFTHRAYAGFLEMFGEFAAEITLNPIHSHDHAGNERSLVEVIDSATRQARKDETR